VGGGGPGPFSGGGLPLAFPGGFGWVPAPQPPYTPPEYGHFPAPETPASSFDFFREISQ
jgi:hypothetical protein